MRHWASPPTLWAFLSSSEREAIRLTSPSKSVSRSVVSNSLHPCELYPTRLLCPRNSPGKNTGVGCHVLLQGIFPTQGLNPSLLRCRQTLPSEPPGKPPSPFQNLQLVSSAGTWAGCLHPVLHRWAGPSRGDSHRVRAARGRGGLLLSSLELDLCASQGGLLRFLTLLLHLGGEKADRIQPAKGPPEKVSLAHSLREPLYLQLGVLWRLYEGLIRGGVRVFRERESLGRRVLVGRRG